MPISRRRLVTKSPPTKAKVDAIDAAVYDLKAVNPRARVERDTHAPAEIIESIANHGRTVEAALAKLRASTQADTSNDYPPDDQAKAVSVTLHHAEALSQDRATK